MMDVVGYATIENGAEGTGAKSYEAFHKRPIRVMEFATDGGVLVLNNEGTALAMFEKDQVRRSFKCGEQNGIVYPPNLGFIAQAEYHLRATNRKGGYNDTVRQLVVMASLHRGEFSDSLLWAKQ